ncbi:unnamed protein product [Rotaria socialis]|uniref:ABC transporter domain-containing protein n=1 Tax=Rotaria socialis TaxID=392032 RepID=A0A817SGF4_9BILA|nr:unnamed protein product [Rotaria socialis]
MRSFPLDAADQLPQSETLLRTIHQPPQLTANETVYELKTYAKTGQIVQEFFSSLRTVLSTVPNLSRNGKSTCISLFLRYYEPSSGEITIDGKPITNYNVQHLRENIGVVSQEPVLFGMTIYENIRFGKLNATQDEIEEAAREANAHNFIMQLPDKYEILVGERGIQLSGGEKQRIALARALVKKPTFLLLDEATSALDNNNEKIVQEALDRACKGRTTIVIAHRLTTIRNADQIYVFDKGNVVEQGTHDTLMGNEGGKYQELVKRQQMEKIDDDQDDPIKMQKAKEEEEEAIGMSERSRLISDTQAVVDGKKTSSKSFIQRFVLLRLLSMNGSEWKTIFIGCVACLFSGASQPLFSVFYANVVGGYETKVGIKGSFLSGGEKQRIAIARVLIRRPKVLLLDEATSAMDSQNEQIVQEALEHAQIEDPSRTSLIIAHRLSTIRSCDSIYVVNKGKLIESGTHTELIQ